MSGFMALLDQKPAASDSPYSNYNRSEDKTLVELCRSVLVSNLEKYPADAFGILDEEEWENVIRVRYERTRPQKGKGGLDGKGRMNPAVGDKFMVELESTIPHLAHSDVVDELVWKDIVEFRYKAGGVSRPKGLLYPWPVLENLAKEHAATLLRISKMKALEKDERKIAFQSIQTICKLLPMDVALLESSGIGKAVNKFLKACSSNAALQIFDQPISPSNIRETPRTMLEAVFQAWKALAAKSGVVMTDAVSSGESSSSDLDCAKHLSKARKCNSWRDLYNVLSEYDEKRRSHQGAKMRARRQRLDSVRPKIVKVRHASSKQNDILNRQPSAVAPSQAKQKIQKLRIEASVTSSRRCPPSQASGSSLKPPPSKVTSGFGAAVAFATSQRGPKRKQGPGIKTTTIQLAGNKRMKVPDSKRSAANMQRLAKGGGFSHR